MLITGDDEPATETWIQSFFFHLYILPTAAGKHLHGVLISICPAQCMHKSLHTSNTLVQLGHYITVTDSPSL